MFHPYQLQAPLLVFFLYIHVFETDVLIQLYETLYILASSNEALCPPLYQVKRESGLPEETCVYQLHILPPDHFEDETAADAGEGKHVSVSSHDPASVSPPRFIIQNPPHHPGFILL